MKLIRGINNIKPVDQHCVASIGNYDGVHLGHQKVLSRVKEQSKKMGFPSLVIVFEPQPMEYFLKEKANARLTTLREKLLLFEDYGIDTVLCLWFDVDLANLTAEQFVQKILIDKLQAQHLVVGDDFSFGRNRTGGFEVLQQYIEVEKIATLEFHGTRISSTHVRQALAVADFKLAAALLGRPYTMSGKVSHGDNLGREFGFPTANIYLRHRVLPFTGVYVAKIYGVDSVVPRKGVINIGTRPTIDGKHKVLEVHVLDFDRSIYGVRISVEFLHKIREEIKFKSLELLKQQIEQDINEARKYGGV